MIANKQNKELTKEAIFCIGRVASVEGRKVKILVNRDKNLSHLSYLGTVIKNISVGSYVKISKGFIEMVGKVEGEYISDEKALNYDYIQQQSKMVRTLDVSLFGHFSGNEFKQGIKEMPLIDNECYLLDKDEFNKLHQFYQEGDLTINIGVLTENPSQEIKISIKKLFASHIGIFGNTGSGKSNTLAKIYSELFKQFQSVEKFQQNSKFVLIDFNGEYGRGSITSKKTIYNLTTRNGSGRKYPVKRDQIEKLEVISVLLEATEKTQKPFLDRALRNKYLDYNFQKKAKNNIENIIKNILKTPVNNLSILINLFSHLKDLENKSIASEISRRLNANELKWHSSAMTYYYDKHDDERNYDNAKDNLLYANAKGNLLYANAKGNLLYKNIFGKLEEIQIKEDSFNKIKFKILSQYYHEIINKYSNQEHINPLIGRMFKKFDMFSKLIKISNNNRKNDFEVINLKEVNLEMKKILPLIICKQLYDEHKRSQFSKNSLQIIIDEAHNILSSSSDRESETWKDYRLETFEEIIKEGRKFSTFLTIASQRPNDISTTIISQLHNYFIHRLINENDIRAIEKTVAYLDKLSFQSIPVLSVGSCFVAGLASNIPVKVDIALLPSDAQPKSETIDLQEIWKQQ